MRVHRDAVSVVVAMAGFALSIWWVLATINPIG